jgi:hypothetical protein
MVTSIFGVLVPERRGLDLAANYHNQVFTRAQPAFLGELVFGLWLTVMDACPAGGG